MTAVFNIFAPRIARLLLCVAGMAGLSGLEAAAQTATTTLVGSSSHPAAFNQPVTFSAFVSGGSIAPGGNVTFSSDRDGALGGAALDVFAANGRVIATGAYHTCTLTGVGAA